MRFWKARGGSNSKKDEGPVSSEYTAVVISDSPNDMLKASQINSETVAGSSTRFGLHLRVVPAVSKINSTKRHFISKKATISPARVSDARMFAKRCGLLLLSRVMIL